MKSFGGKVFVYVFGWLALIFFITALFRSRITSISPISNILKSGDLITLTTFLGASSIAIWWYYENFEQKEDEMKGALLVKPNINDVIKIRNTGKRVLKITKIEMITKILNDKGTIKNFLTLSEYSVIDSNILTQIYKKIIEEIKEVGIQEETNLSPNEEILLLKDKSNTVEEDVFGYVCVVRAIRITYEFSKNTKHIRNVGMYFRKRMVGESENGVPEGDWYIFRSTTD